MLERDLAAQGPWTFLHTVWNGRVLEREQAAQRPGLSCSSQAASLRMQTTQPSTTWQPGSRPFYGVKGYEIGTLYEIWYIV